MSKKAQITAVMIIGMLLAAISGGIFMLVNQERKLSTQQPVLVAEVSSIKDYIESCLDKVSQDALYFAALQGGFVNFDNYLTAMVRKQSNNTEEIDWETFGIPEDVRDQVLNTMLFEKVNITQQEKALMPIFLFYEGNDFFPEPEKEIKGYIEKNIHDCIDFSVLINKGFNIESGEAVAAVNIEKELALISIDFPIKVSKDDVEIKLGKFATEQNIRLGYILDAVSEIVEDQKEFPGYVSLFVTSKFPDLSFNVLTPEEGYLIYMIYDSKSGRVNPYFFIFGIKA